MAALLAAIGLVLSARTRWVQFRYFGAMFALLGRAFQQEGNHLSSFQALVLSVAGLIGMAIGFFECTIAQVFKIAEVDGTYRGRPVYSIECGIGLRWMRLADPLASHPPSVVRR